MNVILKRTSLALICGLFLLSSFALAQSDAKLVLPEVEGWEKGDVATYPSAELGYSVPYQSETAGIVTVYVYNGGLSKIADGIEDANVKAEIRKAESDIKAYGEAGYYQDVKLIKSDTANLGGSGGSTKALYALFSFKVRGAEVDSEIYLLGYHNNFVKIRTTRQKGKNGPDNSEVKRLLEELGKMFAQ
jgi:hypothetical protein